MSAIRLSLWLSTAAFVVLLGAILFEFSYLVGQPDASGFLTETGIARLPAVLYLYALWACRGAAKRILSGEHFGPATRQLLGQVGLALLLGAALETFGIAWLRLLLEDGPGPVASFDPATLTLAAIGLMMIVLSGLWRQAEDMAQELEEFF